MMEMEDDVDDDYDDDETVDDVNVCDPRWGRTSVRPQEWTPGIPTATTNPSTTDEQRTTTPRGSVRLFFYPR